MPGYHRALMSRSVESIDPWHAAEQGRHVSGAVEAGQLPRVSELLADRSGGVQFELEFFRDGQRRHCVRGRVWGHLRLVCQRCLEPMDVEIDAHLLLALVRGDVEAARLPDEYDPLPTSDAPVHPLDLVEDEVILALPQIPVHPQGRGCALQALAEMPQVPRVATSAGGPFQVLEQWKKPLH
jgi:DUF177 domain-containing protein